MIYIGIDPGKSGALAIIDRNMMNLIPFSETDYINAIKVVPSELAVACVEHVGAMPGQGVTSMFNFGQNFGYSGDMNNCIPRVTADAATAITDLLARAEAAEARVKKLAEAIEREQRRAEKAERERDAAVSDLETVMAYGGGNLDTCQFCKNGQCYVRGGTKLCLPKWRGQKEE